MPPCLERLLRADAPADPVQIGNEITGGKLWPLGQLDHVIDAGSDLDVVGQSSYPSWHGTLQQVQDA